MKHRKKNKKKGLGNAGVTYLPQPNSPPTQPDGLTVKETLTFSLLGIIMAGGAVIIGRKVINKAVSGNEQRNTMEDGSIATYAKQIKMAFENDGWWGTNVSALRDVLRQVPDRSSFNKVMTSYQRLYHSSMLGDMQKALKSTEYNEMLAIVSAKSERGANSKTVTITDNRLQEWAKRLKAAFDITYGMLPGTDNDAIKAVFLEIPTQDVFGQLKTTYQSMYGNDLLSDLKSELEFWEYDPMMQIINSKPNS